MNSFDLAGLFSGRARPDLFDHGIVYVPGLMPKEEQERVASALHTLASERLLERLDLTVTPQGLDSSRRRLQLLVDTSRTKEIVVVGWAPEPSTDVGWVEGDVLLKRFPRTVMVVPYPGQAPRLGAWGELLRSTREAVQVRYTGLAEETGLGENVWRSLRPLLPRLLNPLNVLLCANRSIEVQEEGVAGDEQRRRVLADLVRKELSWRHVDEVTALLTLLLGGEAKLADVFTALPERTAILARLAAQRLWRDGELQDWAIALGEPDVLRAALEGEADTTAPWRRDAWRDGFADVLASLGVPQRERPLVSAIGPDALVSDDEPEEPSDELPSADDIAVPTSSPSVEAPATDVSPSGFDPRCPWFFVPFRPKGDGVIGRADALKKVREQLASGRPTSIGQAASFVGLGGLGKTQLAVEYAHTFRDQYPRGVFWFTADEDLDAQLARLAFDARWVSPQAEPHYQVQVAIQQVRTRSECLIIFDNVETLEGIARLMPDVSAKPHLLLTSRVPQSGFDPVPLDRLDEALALEMLASESRRAIDPHGEETAARRIARQVDGLPLALELVGAYLRRYPSVRLEDYADQVEAAGLRTKPLGDGVVSDSFTRHKDGLRATLRVSDAVLDGTPLLRDVLDLMAWSGDAAMGRSLLAAMLGSDSPELGIALGEAESLRILSNEGGTSGIAEPRHRMHRLVREVRRLDMPFDGQRGRWALVPRQVADWFEGRRQEFGELIRFEAEMDHLDAWRAHASSLGQMREVARLLWLRAYPLYHRGHFQRSRTIVQQAWEVLDRSECEDLPFRAHLLHDLGAMASYLNDQQNALKYRQQALAIRRKILGEHHPDTAHSLQELGFSLGWLGDHKTDLEYNRQALGIRRKVLGERHPDTAKSLRHVGNSLGLLGDHRQALGYKQQALEFQRAVLGERHPETAKSLQTVGVSFGDLGDHRKALEHERQALAIQREILGENHPDTLSARRDVIRSLMNLKQKAAAFRVVEEGLKHAPANRELQHLRSEILGRKTSPTKPKRR